jgi:hypothetical protein
MGVLSVLRGVTKGVAEASGNQDAANDITQQQNQARQAQANQLKMQIAPIQQAIAADRQKLTGFMDQQGNVIPEHQKDYDATVKSIGDMMGRLRSTLGQRQPGDDPNHLESTIAELTDKLHITRDLAHRLKTGQQQKRQAWGDQNQQMAQDTAAGTLPFAMTPQGQENAAKTQGALTVEAQRAQDERDLAQVRADNKPEKPDGPLEKDGVFYGAQVGGKEYLAPELDDPNGTAPPAAKQIWATIQAAQQGKQARQDAKDQAIQDRFNRSQERIAAQFAQTQTNLGSWSVVEGENGETQLLNSKTGEIRDAPAGLHKSGYYVKNVAPLEAANLSINDYINGKVFDGPGDLALQHEFFTATQPATGFRMTKVQQDILQNSQNWINSVQGKLYHTLHGTWFSDEQRQQIAKAASEAIANKKKALAGGPKTQELKKTQRGDSPKTADEYLNGVH